MPAEPARRRRRRTSDAARRDDAAVARAAAQAAARGGSTGAHPDARDPRLLSGEIERLVGNRGWELDLRVRGVFARWPDLVGDEVAGHCTPETFADGRLVVRAGSTAWATQLKLLVPDLLRRLNEELGHGTVTVIEVLGPRAPAWTKGRRRTRDSRGPRDTYG
ncbi:MAG: hypothetical protein CMH83_15555 [Nocardioides sp.]|nr:hypothetical protein [Nocardioides sp.]